MLKLSNGTFISLFDGMVLYCFINNIKPQLSNISAAALSVILRKTSVVESWHGLLCSSKFFANLFAKSAVRKEPAFFKTNCESLISNV